MIGFKNRRKKKPFSKEELFKVKNKTKLLKQEKRREEKEKILHVKEQDKTYEYTLAFCSVVIVLFILIALFNLMIVGV
ncbi:MAG: hypothetical protein GY793_06575 [Proteobacteria bacterium]|nr:hypothetical protein [Pseudomonadota bacterium]